MTFARTWTPPMKLRDREPPAVVQRVERSGVYGGSTALVAVPKTVPKRNRALLDLARGRRCLLQAVEGCEGASGLSTVACHSNLSIHGKAGARRADDQFSVWGCGRCHVPWLDQGPAAKAEKQAIFMAAHLRQVNEWRLIVADPSEPPAVRRAAQWALDQLKATPLLAEQPDGTYA